MVDSNLHPVKFSCRCWCVQIPLWSIVTIRTQEDKVPYTRVQIPLWSIVTEKPELSSTAKGVQIPLWSIVTVIMPYRKCCF